MALSARTLIREKAWTKLIRSLDEGVNELPAKFNPMDYFSLKTTCLRENGYDTPYSYIPSVKGRDVTITKIRRVSDAESRKQRMQAE